jgi:prophage regulatory protein
MAAQTKASLQRTRVSDENPQPTEIAEFATQAWAERKESLIRFREVQARTGLSRSHLYALIASKQFPSSIPLMGTSRCFIESEVSAWIAERIAAARQAA